MESKQPINRSEGFIKDTAFKFNAGTMKTEQYGEATLSGDLLCLTPEGFPPINTKDMDDRAYAWLKLMGLEKYQEEMIDKNKVHRILSYCAPDVESEKLEMLFVTLLFGTLLDNATNQLTHLNENNPLKHLEDMTNLIEQLNSILENHGDINHTKAVASKLNPAFKGACVCLSYLCRCSPNHMDKDTYERFIKEMVAYIACHKWIEEYRYLRPTKDEFLHVRLLDIFISAPFFTILAAKDIRLSDEIRFHPIFQRYYKNLMVHFVYVNDIFSLPHEIANSDNLNLILFSCKKYSFQESIYKTVNEANELLIDLMKDKTLLTAYYPTDESLKSFFVAAEYMLHGAFYWYADTIRYGNTKFEVTKVEYACNYNSWLEELGIYSKAMKDPKLSSKSDNVAVPSIYP